MIRPLPPDVYKMPEPIPLSRNEEISSTMSRHGLRSPSSVSSSASASRFDPNASTQAPLPAKATGPRKLQKRRYSAPNGPRPGHSSPVSNTVQPGQEEDATCPHSFKPCVSASSIKFFVGGVSEVQQLPIFRKDVEQAEVSDFLEHVQEKEKKATRLPIFAKIFPWLWKLGLLCIIYFFLVGVPIWKGFVIVLWQFFGQTHSFAFASLLFLSWGAFRAWLPLFFCLFEQRVDDPEKRDASQVAVIIPAYKAAGALPETIEHCLKIFKPEQIFIIANGRSPTPLDNAADVCARYGVNHAWVGIGSKITAEFVGVALAEKYKYILLIDDDVHLPPNFPLVTDRLDGKTACIGYTIKSTGENGSKGTLIQQCQDMEYKLSGLSRTFNGRWGSSTFPHGAVILWDRVVLQKLFYAHPGFTISEDWYFGHVCRSSGYRIQFCSQVFVETETPPCLFMPKKSTRGGYGEMTVWKQRFYRWNFFYLYRLRDDIYYLLFAWRLGRYEILTKFFIFCEVYDSMTYIMRVFIWPISLAASPKITMIYTVALLGVYMTAFTIFNSIHLRRKKEMIAWKVLPVYFGMKFALVFVNTASVYHTMYAYAKYFAVRHPMVTENHDALAAARECMEQARVGKEEAAAAAVGQIQTSGAEGLPVGHLDPIAERAESPRRDSSSSGMMSTQSEPASTEGSIAAQFRPRRARARSDVGPSDYSSLRKDLFADGTPMISTVSQESFAAISDGGTSLGTTCTGPPREPFESV